MFLKYYNSLSVIETIKCINSYASYVFYKLFNYNYDKSITFNRYYK